MRIVLASGSARALTLLQNSLVTSSVSAVGSFFFFLSFFDKHSTSARRARGWNNVPLMPRAYTQSNTTVNERLSALQLAVARTPRAELPSWVLVLLDTSRPIALPHPDRLSCDEASDIVAEHRVEA